MTSLRFCKMHGIGNDFVVLDGLAGGAAPDIATIRAMGHRHTGIGFDQLIRIEPSRDPACAYYYDLWNADGSPAGQCGNGIRCVAAWLHRAGRLELGATMRIASPSGPVTVRLLTANEVTVDMGVPVLRAERIPVALSHSERVLESGHCPFVLDGESLDLGMVSMGNPHAVLRVDNPYDPRAEWLGPRLASDPRFPQGVNVGFVQCLGRSHLALRVYERGAAWTQACGTGACAAMAVCRLRGEVDAQVMVDLPGGRLCIDWLGLGENLWMTGPAAFVFEGEWF